MVRSATDKSDEERLNCVAVRICEALLCEVLLHEPFKSGPLDPVQRVGFLISGTLCRYAGRPLDK